MAGGSREGRKNRGGGGSRVRVERYRPLHDTVVLKKTLSCSETVKTEVKSEVHVGLLTC